MKRATKESIALRCATLLCKMFGYSVHVEYWPRQVITMVKQGRIFD